MSNTRIQAGGLRLVVRHLKLALIGCALGASLASASTAALAVEKAAILLPGSINDQSWNAQGYEGVKRLKAMGWDVAYSENVQPADMAQAMRDYARRGYDVVIGHTGRFQSAAQEVGPRFPKTVFVVGSGSAGSGKNVSAVDFDNTQFGYLEGVLAARMSKTGKIGSVNGLEGLPNVVAQVGAFRKGALSVRPDIQVKIIYVQDMEDAGAAKEAALSLIAWGADFLTGKLNAGQSGIIAAAKDKNIYVTGRSVEDTALAPQNVLTNIVEQWGDMYAAIADAASHGTGGGTYRLYGLNTKGSTGAQLAYLSGQQFNPVVPAAIVQELNDDEKKFAAGTLKVSVTAHDARGGL
ncbi:BMP family protein [Pararobbsia silviterrae]|uniref:BMP family ABC transporter substrate-binding protein n=1 Tax=Pararobbsia silviterrae TaxID=1792498 RepID=A0A494XBT3_9BURK|nr:BMP family protein [Pararobbsia silviterrae]RKP44993.1 BMP family ABC transporter substrate-binding protein [Pararobbsia silviterrae]